MKEQLSHLSEDQIRNLIERYYSGKEKVKDLIHEFGIQCNPGHLYKLFPPLRTELLCPYCNLNLITLYKSKNYSWKDDPCCPQCHHEHSSTCNCKNCCEERKRKHQIAEQAKREALTRILSNRSSTPVPLYTLTFEKDVYLGALLREGISEDYSYIKPLESFINPFAPTFDYSLELLNFLYKNNIIKIHPDSDLKCFSEVKEEDNSYRYYPHKVKWDINVTNDGASRATIIDMYITGKILLEKDSAYNMWRKIALYEALEYLSDSIERTMGVVYKIGDKTVTVMNELLNNFSVSQIYSIIYRSVNSALRYVAETGISYKQAANTVIGSMQSFGEKAILNDWKIQKFHRAKECPESALSKYFFECILPIGYKGFDEIPILMK